MAIPENDDWFFFFLFISNFYKSIINVNRVYSDGKSLVCCCNLKILKNLKILTLYNCKI